MTATSIDHVVTVDGERAGSITEYRAYTSGHPFLAISSAGIVLGWHRSLDSAVAAVEGVFRLLRTTSSNAGSAGAA
jgi:hypothetical protein